MTEDRVQWRTLSWVSAHSVVTLQQMHRCGCCCWRSICSYLVCGLPDPWLQLVFWLMSKDVTLHNQRKCGHIPECEPFHPLLNLGNICCIMLVCYGRMHRCGSSVINSNKLPYYARGRIFLGLLHGIVKFYFPDKHFIQILLHLVSRLSLSRSSLVVTASFPADF